MKNQFRHYSVYAIVLSVLILAFFLTNFPGDRGFFKPGIAEAKITKDSVVSDKVHPKIKETMDVQERHKDELMSKPDVIGTATGIDDLGNASVLVFAKKEVEAGEIPDNLEGIPVNVKVTGEFTAMKVKGYKKNPIKVSNTSIFPLPVPIGISTGNIGECSSGTIGARVTDGTNVYALSNNHVYALENNASIGSQVLQPGLYDTSCALRGNNNIGTLSAFVPINFSGGTNTLDAAIALSSKSLLGNSTPSTGYGTPGSTPVAAALGMAVQKYGRTTSLTKGTIAGINATVTVYYGTNKTATFVNQIIVTSQKAFIKAGDSGSLLVTYPEANPVGLLFAGNSSGTYVVANSIQDVLSNFGVTIDGK